MLTGLARPDAGTVHIGGIDCTGKPRAAQHLIGVVPDESNLYPELTGYDNLCFCAALYGMKKAERNDRARELLDDFGLAKAADRKLGGYSKGMKRKIAVAAGVIHRPEILFLDEPTTGIDVAGARQLRQLIEDLHRSGTTIFLTTHYIEEAERLCDRIAFIVSGSIVRIDTVEDLLQPVRGRHVVRIACSGLTDEVRSGLGESFPDLDFTFPGQGYIRVESREDVRVGPLVRFLEDRGAEVFEARRMRPSLEDVFVKVTGHRSGRHAKGKATKRGRRKMKLWIAFWNILKKDMRTYYLKPPNVSWGIIFPLAWTGMFFIKSGSGLGKIPELLPGVVAVSVLFGTTSMLAVTVTFEKKNRTFERLLLAPVPLELLMLAKTSGAILFGTANAFVPIVMAAFLTDLSGMVWGGVRPPR